MLSLAERYYQIVLAQGVCVGIGSGMVYVSSLAMVSISFVEHRALALATVTSGAAIGGVVYPIALQRLLPLVGFGWSTRILGFMALFTFLVGVPLVLWHNGDKFKPKAPRAFLDTSALREKPFVAFCVAMFLVFLAYYVPFFYLPDFAQEKVGSSTDFSVYLLAMTNAATFPSRFISAMAARSIGRLNTLSICVGASTIVLLSWIGVSSLAGLDVWAVFWGFTAGPLVTIPAAVVPQLSPSPGVVGTRMGMIWLCAAMGECIYQPRSRVIEAGC
ncbi:MFS general substrate transporter [Sphaerulina musiva SO2202]|uniref:MFS general substrate transporter n=1 Tax=Sphaerulina musiva (strain SO2202) TaxID=692275 RepID=M3D6U6_SPHMS|nr:MFS general substrate transporter [Sphaerulina musiva SO2202]EMF13880.1 MFS general substrate transporter [Sphaerulina musiva SO2202]